MTTKTADSQPAPATDPRAFKSFADFYPFYLSEHSNRTCRRLHFVGSTLTLVCLAMLVAVGLLGGAGVALAQEKPAAAPVAPASEIKDERALKRLQAMSDTLAGAKTLRFQYRGLLPVTGPIRLKLNTGVATVGARLPAVDDHSACMPLGRLRISASVAACPSISTGVVSGMLAGMGITLYYIVRTHPFFGGSMAEAWFDISPISCGIFGVLAGFIMIAVVSLLTPPPSPQAQALVERHAALAAAHGVRLSARGLADAGRGYGVVLNSSASSLAGEAVPVHHEVLGDGARTFLR